MFSVWHFHMEDDFAFPQKQFQNNFLVDKYTCTPHYDSLTDHCSAPYVPATFGKQKKDHFFVSASLTNNLQKQPASPQ
jgi:hypothetical protein